MITILFILYFLIFCYLLLGFCFYVIIEGENRGSKRIPLFKFVVLWASIFKYPYLLEKL